jgi:TonB family protein
MAVEPPPVTAPDPPIPSTVATLAAVDSSAETARESDATPTAIASDASDADLPIDPLPDYVADVRSRIESKKRYPAMARRRSEEGLVVARVSIGTDGRVAELEIDGAGPLSLRRATRAAVENAAPFPMPPRGAVVIEVPIRWRVLD